MFRQKQMRKSGMTLVESNHVIALALSQCRLRALLGSTTCLLRTGSLSTIDTPEPISKMDLDESALECFCNRNASVPMDKTIAFSIIGQAYPPVVFDWSRRLFWARDLSMSSSDSQKNRGVDNLLLF